MISVEGTERGRVPIHQLGAVSGFGRVSMSPAAMGFCAEQGVSVAFLTEHGRFLARVEGAVSGNVLLRREQHRRADDRTARAAVTRSIVIGKAINQRAVVRRALRDHSERLGPEVCHALAEADRRLTDAARRSRVAPDVNALRGIEGEAARLYFGVFDGLILARHERLRFSSRSRRPPLDPVNALLSFVYALLAQDCRSALEVVGLDPAVGFLHADRPGRPSLALDLMEEFRPFFADRLVLSLINRGQVTERNFSTFENGAVAMTETGRKTVLVAYQERKREELIHPFLREKTPLGLAWHLQARLLARHLRGETDAYPPFLWE